MARHSKNCPPRVRRQVCRLLAFAFMLAMGAMQGAHAAFNENLATSVTAMSLGNAVTADPPGIESIHFNPAGLARIKEDKQFNSFFVASIKSFASFHQPEDFDIGGWKDDPLAGTSSGPTRMNVYIPGYGMPGWRLPVAAAGGMGFAFNKEQSLFTFATLTYPQSVGSFDHTTDPNDPMRFSGKKMLIQRVALVSPAVGYQVSDTLRVGVAVPVSHQAMVIDTDVRMPNKFLGIIGKVQQGWCSGGGNPLDTFTLGLCGGQINPFQRVANIKVDMTAPMDPTINLGILWEPQEWFALGAVYQGGSKAVHTGRYEIRTDPMMRKFVEGMYSSLMGPVAAATTGMPQSIPEVQQGNLTARIAYPAHWQVGFKLKPVSRLQFNADANYSKWSDWDVLALQFDQSIKLLEAGRVLGITDTTQFSINSGLRSVVHWGFGMQVEVSKKLTLRFGYEPRKSSIPPDKFSLLTPIPDTKIYSAGFKLALSGDTEINVGASYMKGDFNAPARSSCNLNCDGFFNAVYNPYAGLDVAGGIRMKYVGISLTKPF